MSQWLVEHAEPSDIVDWLELAAEVGALFGADMAHDPVFRQRLERNIARGSAFRVRLEGELAGAMLFRAGTIHWLAVRMRFQRRGVAAALVERAISDGAEVRVTTFGAEHPHPDSQAARILYRRFGFQPVADGEELARHSTPLETLLWRANSSTQPG